MLLDQDTVALPRDAHLRRWFLTAGAVGVLTAVVLAVGLGYDTVSIGLVEALWPMAPVQLIDPKTIGSKIAVGLIAYGSNFFLYGLAGMGIGSLTNRLLDRRTNSRPG